MTEDDLRLERLDAEIAHRRAQAAAGASDPTLRNEALRLVAAAALAFTLGLCMVYIALSARLIG